MQARPEGDRERPRRHRPLNVPYQGDTPAGGLEGVARLEYEHVGHEKVSKMSSMANGMASMMN